jgi:hypothetical protein
MGAFIVAVGGLVAILICLLLIIPIRGADLEGWVAELLDWVEAGRPGEVVPLPLLVGVCATLLWWRGVRTAAAEHGETAGSFVAGVTAMVGLLVLAAVLPPATAIGEMDPGDVSRDLSSTMAPFLFLLSLPAAVVFAVLSRLFGEHAFTLSQLALVIGLLLLGSILPVGPPRGPLVIWILIFLASGLATLSLLGVLRTLRDQERRIGVRLRVDRYWLMTMLIVVAGVLVLGSLVGRIIAPGTIADGLRWIRPVWTLFLNILLLIIYVFAYLFFSLIEPLLAGIQSRPREVEPRPFQSPLDLESLQELQRDPIEIPPIFTQIVQAVLIVGGIALVAWIFYVAVKSRKRDQSPLQEEVLETRDSVLTMDLLRSQIGGILDGLRRRGPPPLFLEPGDPGDPRRVVRELYQQLLARAIDLGSPRRRGQTPAAYQSTLLQFCPEERASLETLTRVYVVARYGTLPPTGDQVQAAQEAYTRIDNALKAKFAPIEY